MVFDSLLYILLCTEWRWLIFVLVHGLLNILLNILYNNSNSLCTVLKDVIRANTLLFHKLSALAGVDHFDHN